MSKLTIAFAALMAASPAVAQEARHSASYGPVFAEYGWVADVEADFALPADAHFRHSFDVAERTEDGRNRGIESAARFINMHARAGVPADRIEVAIVIHGQAVNDVLGAEAYTARHDGAENPSAGLVRALLDQGVRIVVCGQSVAGLGVDETADLIPGVQTALSAMTAHALLQQQGYTVNPF